MGARSLWHWWSTCTDSISSEFHLTWTSNWYQSKHGLLEFCTNSGRQQRAADKLKFLIEYPVIVWQDLLFVSPGTSCVYWLACLQSTLVLIDISQWWTYKKIQCVPCAQKVRKRLYISLVHVLLQRFCAGIFLERMLWRHSISVRCTGVLLWGMQVGQLVHFHQCHSDLAPISLKQCWT